MNKQNLQLIYINPNLQQDAENAECAHMYLDDLGIPRIGSGDKVYSLVGRIMFLSTPEPKQDEEPVAWMFFSSKGRPHYHLNEYQALEGLKMYGGDRVIALYEHPAPVVADSASTEEPVAWMSGMRDLLSWDKFYEDMSPLYLHPEPKTKQITTEQRLDGYKDVEKKLGKEANLRSFLEGICFAEKHHGILNNEEN